MKRRCYLQLTDPVEKTICFQPGVDGFSQSLYFIREKIVGTLIQERQCLNPHNDVCHQLGVEFVELLYTTYEGAVFIDGVADLR